MWPIAPAPSLRHAPAACSTASPPALPPHHAPRLAASLCPHQEIQREGSPFLQSPHLPAPAVALMSWRELGLDLDAWKILDLLVLELLIHQLLLQTPSGCCGSQRHGEEDHGMGKTKTCSSHMPLPRARLAAAIPRRADDGGPALFTPPAPLLPLLLPAACSPTTAQRLEEDLVQRNGVRVRMLVPLI